MSDTSLVIEIRNTQPVELLDYSESMIALTSLYNRHLSRNPELTYGHDARLYVKEIRPGSIITELQDLLPYAIPFIDYTNNIVDFAQHLKGFLYLMSGKTKELPQAEANLLQSGDTADFKNFQRFLNPVAKDNGSQLNVGAINVNGPVTVNFTLSSTESNAAQNKIQRLIDSARTPNQTHFEKVVFVWSVAKTDITSQSGDRGIISTISDRAVKILFDTQGLKEAMLAMSENPLYKAFVVDVEVSYVEGKPIAYKIMRLHEYFNI